MLRFQTLDSYKVAIRFVALTLQLIRSLPRGHGRDADQLRRSAKSIARNIAEGAGRVSGPDKAKHYTIARGEAFESACSLDVMAAEGVVSAALHQEGNELLTRIVSMLTKAIQNLRIDDNDHDHDHDHDHDNDHHHHHHHDHGSEKEKIERR